MADDRTTQRLGRGLAALIGDMERRPVPEKNPATDDSRALATADRTIPIEKIVANRNNPRLHFSEDELEELANSIATHGLVQPVLVRPFGTDAYELIAGERRWRASQKAGLHKIPVVIRDVDDRQALELAIIENVQRADLNPVEEAKGYHQLMDEHEYTQVELAKVIGKSRSHVANTMRLLRLPTRVQSMLGEGSLSSGHARALITLDNPEPLARRIIEEGLSVRETERLANAGGVEKTNSKSSGKKAKDGDTLALERRLSDLTGMKIAIAHREDGKGKVTIDYRTLEQLDEIVARFEK